MAGAIISINIASRSGEAPEKHEAARLDEGKGIVGDRYYGVHEDAQITLVDADTIARINGKTGWSLTPEETRRNIVTEGIDLNQWETSRFRVGDAILEGVELCEPCATLGGMLENESRTSAEVVKALTHGAGLRARVVKGADIQVGDSVRGESD
ncbi:MAG: MOSC domain-containing protein [Pseudomonadales bacterium]|nr:MOSC domain-containing protein [Pseudomonadales bacterium]